MSFHGSPGSWPALYDPGVEILHIEHHEPVQPDGHYLYYAGDIFRFTLYWTLLFYTPIFMACGLYAFCNINFPPSPRPHNVHDGDSYPLSSLSPAYHVPPRSVKPPKENARRSRLAFALLVLLTYMALGVAGAVIGSAVLGFVVMGLYRAGDMNMSTWIPFLMAISQVVIGLLSIWPTVIDII